MAELMMPALRIAAKQDGRRRAGIAHAAAATLHLAGRFTAEQVDALRADPMLVVELVADETQAATGAAYTPATDGAAQAAGPVALPTAGGHGGEAAGTHAQAEGGPAMPAAPASAAGAAEGAGQGPAAEGHKPPANPAEGAAGAPAVPAEKPKPPKKKA